MNAFLFFGQVHWVFYYFRIFIALKQEPDKNIVLTNLFAQQLEKFFLSGLVYEWLT